jgi:hypothetical protein
VISRDEVMGMLVSAEVRWFWEAAPPIAFEEWFRKGGFDFAPGGDASRTDVYLLDPGLTELGLKKRGERPGVEIKGLVTAGDTLYQAGPFAARVQVWAKWASATLRLDGLPTVKVGKRRWLRKYDLGGESPREIELDEKESPRSPSERLPDFGCNVELTRVSICGGPPWYTVGCESFGPLHAVVRGLERTLDHLASRSAPASPGGLESSYPLWLSRHGPKA